MKLKFKNIIITILIFIIGAITIFWFKNNNYIAGGDVTYTLFPTTIIKSLLTSWSNKYFLGSSTATLTNAVFPYLSFWALFKTIGFKLLTVEKIWQFCLTISTGFSFYYLIKSFYPKLKTPAMALAVLYYMVCPFVFVLYTPPSNSLISSLIFTPLLLALIHNLFLTNNKKYIYFIALSSMLLIGMGVNIPTMMASLFPSVIYIFIKIIRFKKNIEPLKKLLLATIYSFFINSFWVGQLLLSFNNQNIAASTDLNWLTQTSSNANLLNLIRSIGHWSFDKSAYGSKYFTYSELYFSNFYYILSFILSSIIFTSLFNRKKNYWFFVILFLSAIFIAKGSNAPFGNIFIWCYKYIPYFNMFREPLTKFAGSIVLSGSILFGLGSDFIFNKVSKIKKKKLVVNIVKVLITIIIGSVITVYSLPFFNGQIISTDRGNFPGTLTQIPTYFYQMVDWLNNESDINRIIFLPASPFYQIHLFWGQDGYYGIDPANENATKSTITLNPGGYIIPKYSEEVISSVYNKISKLDDNFDIEKAFSILRCNYILFRNDLDWTQINTSSINKSPEKINQYIKNKFDLSNIISFGTVEKNNLKKDEWFNELLKTNSWLDGASANVVYKINNIKLEDEINVNTNNNVVYNNLEDFADIISLPMINKHNNFTFLDNSINNINNIKEINNDYLKLIKINEFSYNKNNYEYNLNFSSLNSDIGNHNYDVYVNIDRDAEDCILKINDSQFVINNQSSGWTKIGNINLEKDNIINYLIKNNHNISNENIIKNGNFTNNLEYWNLINLDEEKIINDNKFTKTNDNSIILNSGEHNIALRQIIDDLSPGDYYLINFDYKNISGEKPKVNVEFLSENSTLSSKVFDNLINDKDWHTVNNIVEADSTKMLLYLYSDSHSQNIYKNITIKKISKPDIKDLVFYSQQETNTNSPTIQVTKNSTFLQEYEVKISNASSGYILNFMQSYDKGWRAEIVEDKKYKPDHIVSQGYANGWVIDKTGDYTVKIYYFPQKIILCLFGVSLLSIIFVIIQSLRKHEKKK